MKPFFILIASLLIISCGKPEQQNGKQSELPVIEKQDSANFNLSDLNGDWMNTELVNALKKTNSTCKAAWVYFTQVSIQDTILTPTWYYDSPQDLYFKEKRNGIFFFENNMEGLAPIEVQPFGDSIKVFEKGKSYIMIRGNIFDYYYDYLFSGKYNIIYDSLKLGGGNKIVFTGDSVKGFSQFNDFFLSLDYDTELHEDYILLRKYVDGNMENQLQLHWEKRNNRLYFYKYLADSVYINMDNNEKQLALILEKE